MPDEITDLANIDMGTESVVDETMLANVEQVMTSSGFLPRLQINTSNTKLVSEGKSPLGIFCLVHNSNKHTDLGKEVVFLAVSVRSKALLMPTGATPVTYYDPKTPEFEAVVEKASLKGMNGAMYGPEFLIWIPSLQCFATFFHSSETLRHVAPAVVQVMRVDANNPRSGLRPGIVRGKTKMITSKDKKFTWWGYEAFPESSPVQAPPENFRELFDKELEKFRNPPVSHIEPAGEPVASGDRVR